jgi:hypothetical protein
MRKIDKSVVLSSVYKAWLDTLEKPHGSYTSSKHKFYGDIVMALYHCQNGLCAYTERRLCEDKYFELSNWQLGEYVSEMPSTEGELEHFDPTLKAEQCWLWDNLLMILGKANNQKGEKSVNTILKPDSPEYDPFRLLDYDFELDVFLPNLALETTEQERVKYMIETLCINAGYVKMYRKPFLKRIKAEIELYKNIEWNDLEEPRQFPTAFEMLKRTALKNRESR